MEPHMNGGNPEHKCPETGFPALCFQKACETRTCEGSQRQHLEFEYAVSDEKDRRKRKYRVTHKK